MMLSRHLLGVVICAIITFTHAEDKWVWSSERKSGVIETETARITVAKPIISDNSPSGSESSRKIDEQILRLFDNDDYRKARYEVQEPTDYVNGRPILPPRTKPYIKPLSKYPNHLNYPDNRPPPPPFSNRYPPSLPPPPPISRPGPNEFVSPIPAGNSPAPVRRPPGGGAAVGILTGPVPSWEKPVLHKNGDPTNFEHCKCSFSFNCKSPGIQFGSCDQGKTYCCYNEFNSPKEIPVQPNGFGSTNIERFDKSPPVLIGPGGPTRPLDHREGYRPFIPPYEGVDGNLDPLDYDRRRPPTYPIIPNRPILPPYMGLHNDYRSSK